jgi:hypothetical protein
MEVRERVAEIIFEVGRAPWRAQSLVAADQILAITNPPVTVEVVCDMCGGSGKKTRLTRHQFAIPSEPCPHCTNGKVKATSAIAWKRGDVAKIKVGWEHGGRDMLVLGPAVFLEQWWVPVKWPYEDDPTFHKEAGLERAYENAAQKAPES